MAQKITREIFKLPLTHTEACDALNTAIMAEVLNRKLQFKPSRELSAYISRAAEWLTSDNHTAGLMLCGTCGNGKTTMMNAIATLIDYCDLRNHRGAHISVTRTNAKSLAQLSKTDYEAFKRYFTMPMLAIDDMGFEPAEVMHYGNIVSPLVDLFESRYNGQSFTMVTTNLTPQQIRERYGERISDRFREMMTRIIFENKSYR